MRSIKLSVIILTGLTALSLTACGTPSSGPQIVREVEYVGVPTHLLNDCVGVDLAGLSTNGDMARALLEQDKALQDCTADKRAIRALQPAGQK